MSVFSERLRNARVEKGIKQAEIAEKLGVSVQSYSAYENGREPNYDILLKIAKILDVEASYLIGESDYKHSLNSDICSVTGLSERAVEVLAWWKKLGDTPSSYVHNEDGTIVEMKNLNGEPVKYADIISELIEDYSAAEDMKNYVNEDAFYTFVEAYANFFASNKEKALTEDIESTVSAAGNMLTAQITMDIIEALKTIQGKTFAPTVEGMRQHLKKSNVKHYFDREFLLNGDSNADD